MELAIDRVLDQRYRIIQPIGTGGSSQVYLANDQALGREVAIKVLDSAAAHDADVRKRFVKEARALAQLSHPNIVSVFDVGEVDGLPFIVMERLEASLKAVIERQGSLDVGDAVRIAGEISAGLSAAHARGIVHADMKPSNILFDAQGRAKIADFGIARTPQDAAETPQLFATAMYVAPERVEGHPATAASDIYGLGLILYEMLVGKPPFTSTNAAVLLRDHVVRPPVPPSHLRPSLPREVDAIVLKALAKEPNLRFPRAMDIARALQRIEGLDEDLAPVSIRNDQTSLMRAPLEGILPYATDSPVVALLAHFAQPVRRLFYTGLLLLPLWGILTLSGVPWAYAALFAGLPAIIALAGHMGTALAICWVIESLMLFLFVPVLAVAFMLSGLWLAVREYSPERAIFALAGPALTPTGLAPFAILASSSLHGLGGILATAWGAVMAVTVALAQGQPTSGPFVVTGLLFHQPNLIDTPRAVEARLALTSLLQPGGTMDQRMAPLAALFDPAALADQIVALGSRFAGAELTATIGTIAAWVLAAAMVWVATRVFRMLMDTLFPSKRWFAVYLLASLIGIFSGAALLYGLFVTWRPLAETPDAFADSVLFLSALTGAILALATTLIIGATRPQTAAPSEDLSQALDEVRQKAAWVRR